MDCLVIAHVIYSFDKIGGLENGVINIINNLSSKKIKHIVCSLTNFGEIRNRVTNANVTYYELNKKEGNDISIVFKLYNIFRIEKVNAVHLRNWVTMVEGFFPAKILHIPNIIYSEHGRHFEDLDEGKAVTTFIKKVIFSRVDSLVSVSSELAQEMVERYQIDRQLIVIQNGVDTERFKPVKAAHKQKIRGELGLAEKGIVVGSVARLDKGKNYLAFLEHFLKYQDESVRFVLAGDGPEFRNLSHYIEKHSAEERVLLLGARDDIPKILKAYDVFVLPSLSEGLSNVLLEALAVGLPIVAYGVGGNSEVIDDKGGVLVKLKNEIGFQETIQMLVEQEGLRREMGTYNREKAEKNFSIYNMINQYRHLYRDGNMK